MRLSEELRERTKRYASAIIGLYVQLPKQREEVRVLGKQLLRAGTSVVAHAREASRGQI
jgi:four helix bundle protein